MADDIDTISEHLHITRRDATALVSYMKSTGSTLNRGLMMLRWGKMLAADNNLPLESAMRMAQTQMDSGRVITNKRNLPKDRHDTQQIGKKFTQLGTTDMGEIKFMREVPQKRKYIDVLGRERTDRDKAMGTRGFIPTTSHLRSDEGNEIRIQRQELPKYYYFDIDGLFDVHGHDTSPQHDRQFRDKSGEVPFVVAQVIDQRGEMKHSSPARDEFGRVIDVNGNVVNLKDPEQIKNIKFESKYGHKTTKLDFFVGNDWYKSDTIITDYTMDVRFNLEQERKKINYIISNLAEFIKDNNAKLPYEKLSKLAQMERDKKLTPSEVMFNKYDGEGIEYNPDRDAARKRKLANIKAKAKCHIHKKPLRKPSLKKKTVKKCVCKRKPIKNPVKKVIKKRGRK